MILFSFTLELIKGPQSGTKDAVPRADSGHYSRTRQQMEENRDPVPSGLIDEQQNPQREDVRTGRTATGKEAKRE